MIRDLVNQARKQNGVAPLSYDFKLGKIALLHSQDMANRNYSSHFTPEGQGVYPRPAQNLLPIWLGVGGTPQSFARADAPGLPLMVAIIDGETRRFRPLVDLYREAGRRSGYSLDRMTLDRMRVGVHS